MLDAAASRVVYTGNNSTDTFAVEDESGNPIYFTDNAHIYARTYNTSTEVYADLEEGVDYTLTGGPDAGELVLSAGNLATGTNLAIWRAEPFDQDADFSVSSDFSSTTHNNVADRHRRIDQDLNDGVTRALKYDRHGIYFDAESLPIRNLDDPENAQDAVTKAYGDANYGGSSVTLAAASASAAASSASAAASSASAAASSASSASSSASAAAASGLVWIAGGWVTATAYAVADATANNGSSYRCKEAHTSGASSEPGVGGSWTTYWDLIASIGASGDGSGDMVASTYDPAGVNEQLVGLSATQTLANKTLTAPVISTISNTGTVTLPTATDTLVGKATTDTLTNKTINLTSNTLTGTAAQFNTACSDGNFVYAGNNLSDIGTAATAFSNIKQDATTSATGVVEWGTTAEYRSKTASKAIEPSAAWGALAEVTLTDGASIALDMSTGFDFVVTLGGNRTLANATNTQVGQRGRIRVVQDGTGSRTLSFGTSYEFVDQEAAVMSTDAAAEDLLYYDVISSTRIFVSKAGDIG